MPDLGVYNMTTLTGLLGQDDLDALYKTYADVFGNPPGNLLNLTLVSDLGK